MLPAIEAAGEVVDCSARKWRTTATTTTCTTTASTRTDAAQRRYIQDGYIDRQQQAERNANFRNTTQASRALAPSKRAPYMLKLPRK